MTDMTTVFMANMHDRWSDKHLYTLPSYIKHEKEGQQCPVGSIYILCVCAAHRLGQHFWVRSPNRVSP